jgi:hypothetical protein
MAKPKTRNRKAATRQAVPTGKLVKASRATPPVASGSLDAMALAAIPTGAASESLALAADVSGEFAALTPTFGDLLVSIGTGVANSQAALDNGLVESAKLLNQTKVKVITEVVQELNDDGLPVLSETELPSQEVSLINYVRPTIHQWEHVALSMDLSVGAMDRETGLTFTKRQSTSSHSQVGLFWGFLGWHHLEGTTRTNEVTQQSRQEADWATGQVRLDAKLAPRNMGEFPKPFNASIGPQIYFSQGGQQETKSGGIVVSRSTDLVIKVLKASGEVNDGVTILFDAERFRFAFVDDDTYDGNTTNTDGEVKLTVTRDIPNANFSQAITGVVTATLGHINKSYEIRL